MIGEHDKLTATEPTWHGLEQIVSPEETKRFKGSPLDFEVGEEPIFTPDMVQIEGYKRITAPTVDGEGSLTLQVANETYGVVQNEAIFEAIEKAMTGVDYTITCVGTLDDRSRGFFSLAMADNQDYLVNGDKFKAHSNVIWGHDSQTAIHAIDSTTRVVCGNTMSVVLGQARSGGSHLNLKLRHTSQAAFRIDGFAEKIEQLLEKRAEFFTSLEYLNENDISHNDADAFIWGHTVGVKLSEATNRRVRPAEDISLSFRKGDGNKGETLYDLFNGYTEVLTRKAVLSDPEKNAYSSEWGGGAKRKTEAYAALVDPVKRKAAIDAGYALVKA
jgi:hypothetical protein